MERWQTQQQSKPAGTNATKGYKQLKQRARNHYFFLSYKRSSKEGREQIIIGRASVPFVAMVSHMAK